MVAGFFLCLAWYYTIIAGFFVLYCPVLYLVFFNHKLYRKVVDVLFAVWELYPVALFQCCYGTKFHHFGDYVNPNENTIIVMNHRTRVDWNYVWIGLYHATQKSMKEQRNTEILKDGQYDYDLFNMGGTSKIKFVLKDEIKFIPCLGWIMQLNYFLYLKRNWREDELSLTEFTDYYKRLNCTLRVVLFPEGTDLCEQNRHRSNKYALKNNLPCYDYVLHPRTTGWVELCIRFRESGLTSVYDVTIAYDNPAQTELDLLRGNMPLNVYFHIKRYSIDQLPKDETLLKDWLSERWQEKEVSLHQFHINGNFIDAYTNKSPSLRSSRSMLVAKTGFVFWTLINVIFTYAMFYSVFFQYWIIYHSLLFIFVTWNFGGFHKVQNKLAENEL